MLIVFQQKSVTGHDEETDFFRVTEAVFVGWFTLEFISRFLVSPYKVIQDQTSSVTTLYIYAFSLNFLSHFLTSLTSLEFSPSMSPLPSASSPPSTLSNILQKLLRSSEFSESSEYSNYRDTSLGSKLWGQH